MITNFGFLDPAREDAEIKGDLPEYAPDNFGLLDASRRQSLIEAAAGHAVFGAIGIDDPDWTPTLLDNALSGGGGGSGDWILSVGVWNDAGVWDDTAMWKDAA